MNSKTRRLTFFFLMSSFLLFSCNFASNLVNRAISDQPASTENEIFQGTATPQFSEITFCTDVTDDGDCLEQTDEFPSGTNTVWSFFTYDGMQDGMSWGRLWMQDDELYVDAMDETWEDGESGWLAFSISDDIPLTGNFTFTLFIEDEVVQEAYFSIAEDQTQVFEGAAAFGAIQFSTGMDLNNNIPTNISTQFTEGITEVYASFVYLNMVMGQNWSREWLFNGEQLVRKDIAWDETEGDGLTYAFYHEEDGIDAGSYTLNLYVDDQLARSANFEVVSSTSETPNATTSYTVEDLVDADLMKAWEMLSNSNNELLWRLADLVTSFQIEIRMSDDLADGTLAAYSYSLDSCEITESGQREPGIVRVNHQAWNEQSWEEVAASIAHELTHAYQHLQTGYRCDNCSVQKEYEAFFVTIYALEELDAWGIIERDYPNVVSSEGNIDSDTLWNAIKDSYTECPEY